jgi:hypothetical protein
MLKHGFAALMILHDAETPLCSTVHFSDAETPLCSTVHSPMLKLRALPPMPKHR